MTHSVSFAEGWPGGAQQLSEMHDKNFLMAKKAAALLEAPRVDSFPEEEHGKLAAKTGRSGPFLGAQSCSSSMR